VALGSGLSFHPRLYCPTLPQFTKATYTTPILSTVQFFYDPYDWSFPPDLLINGQLIKPSLEDLGLDESWDKNDPSNLSNVLGKLSRMMQASPTFSIFSCHPCSQKVLKPTLLFYAAW